MYSYELCFSPFVHQCTWRQVNIVCIFVSCAVYLLCAPQWMRALTLANVVHSRAHLSLWKSASFVLSLSTPPFFTPFLSSHCWRPSFLGHLVPEQRLTFWFQNFSVSDFCQFFEGFGFREFGPGKVLISVSENLVLKKVSVSDNLVSEKILCFNFEEFSLGNKSQYLFQKTL